ncbi:unnamed protein product [Phytophthora fragariaefolia]|uniref:Unnamed protein product n=1 Tax=Phytophthora fragariaefolia TaxID=1490495 RepID=A0A9W6U6G8_9STRA|nr:unnamed protein product [Phytophthora fragariaefolia]
MRSVQDALGDIGTTVHIVPPGCTGVAQPLDVGVMSPLKMHMQLNCAQAAVLNGLPEHSVERCPYMFDQAMLALAAITPGTKRKAFDRAGPYLGCTTSNDVQGMLDEASLLNVVDAQLNDFESVQGVVSGGVHHVPAEAIAVAGLHIRSTSTLVQHALMDTFRWATCSVVTIHSRKHYYWQKATDICQ